jgi:hypothetical protein
MRQVGCNTIADELHKTAQAKDGDLLCASGTKAISKIVADANPRVSSKWAFFLHPRRCEKAEILANLPILS